MHFVDDFILNATCALKLLPYRFRMTHSKLTLASIVRQSAPIALAIASLAIVWSSLATIANFAFRYPAFDQYRLYQVYLGLPFPQNAIQGENGHRPILPVLLRLAEIQWFSADQWLQIGAGIAFVVSAFALIACALLCEHGLTRVQKSAGILATALAIFWLGNARMLMHGNELICTYLVVLMLVLIGWAIHAARSNRPAFWLGMAALCALAATFSFGTGMACFSALFVGALLVGLPWRAFVVPAMVFIGALAAYVFGLPGNVGVRNVMLLDPIGNVAALLRWLSSPWMNAWLGTADPPLTAFVQNSALQHHVGQAVVASARAIASPWGDRWMMQESVVVGFFGVSAWIVMLGHAWRHRASLSRIRLLSVLLATLGIGAAAIICLARLHLFQVSPAQVFADRYLPWSCLFWLGLGLYAGCSTTSSSPRRGTAFAAITLACAVISLPTHRSMAGWSATVHRHIQQSAVAAQLGIWDPERFPDGDDASRADVLASLALLRKYHLSMFSEPGYGLVENGWHAQPVPTATFAGATACIVREFENPLNHHHVADFEGWMPRVGSMPDNPVLVVADDKGALRGLAKLSYLGPAKISLRFSIGRQGGFDGYVLDPKPGENLRVIVLDNRNRVFSEIPLHIPADSGTDP